MDIYAALKLSPLFRDMDRRVQRALAETVDWLELRGGEFLYRIGERGDALYLVVNGRVRITRPQPDGEEQLLGEAALGETIGETSVISGGRRTTNAVALRDSDLLRISKQTFERLLRRHPDAMFRVARLIVDRLQAASAHAVPDTIRNARTYALLPAHEGIDIRGFAKAYANRLADGGATLRLDPERVDNALGEDAAAIHFDDAAHNRRLASWLSRLEDRYRYLIYQASGRPDAWTRRCLRQADRILVVAHADREPGDSPNLEWLHKQPLRAAVELVLLDGSGTPGASVLEWRTHCDAAFHHHVGMDLPDADMGRLARLTSGRALCLVLGGGGARGFAHVGLLRALQEKGVPVDAVGGTSMGALVAAMVAMDMDAERILETLRASFVDKNYLNDYAIASRMRISLIGAQKFRARLEEIFGDTRIEDLRIPFYCLSTNLSRGSPVVHDSGRLSDWVGTSMAVPGIAPPTVYRGDLLVDGGLLHSIPFDAMLEMGRGHIVVSDVGTESDLRIENVEDDKPESLNNIADVPKHLSIFKILFHAATLTSEYESRDLDERADLVLHMPVGDTGMFDWEELDNIVYRAYHYADEVLDRYLADNPGLPRAIAATAA